MKIGLLSFGIGTPLLYLFILLADPYGSVPFSFPADRAPVDKYLRYFHPMLAGKDDFDSAIIGTSTIRLLKPQRLNKRFNASFINLSMNAASPYEQSRIFEIFIRHHEKPAFVIFGIDDVWCNKNLFVKHIAPIKAQNFPEWLYDESSTNKLPPYTLQTLIHATRQALYISGIKEYKYGLDGYTNFTHHMSRYNLEKARLKIYGQATPYEKPSITPPVKVADIDASELDIPAINTMITMLNMLPAETVKILVFPPPHAFALPARNSLAELKLGECKRRYTELITKRKNSYLLDFMIESDISRYDENFWDGKHYTINVADRIEDIIADSVIGGKPDNQLVSIRKGIVREKLLIE